MFRWRVRQTLFFPENGAKLMDARARHGVLFQLRLLGWELGSSLGVGIGVKSKFFDSWARETAGYSPRRIRPLADLLTVIRGAWSKERGAVPRVL